MQATVMAAAGGLLPLRPAAAARTAGAADKQQAPRSFRCSSSGCASRTAGSRLVARASDSEETTVSALGAACSIDDMANCSLANLEEMYVSALWSFYADKKDGKFNITNEQYDRLKDELAWQGSGFPTLKRDEIKFVQASIAKIRGELPMSEKDFNALKAKIVLERGKRRDVTALLLAIKGQQLLDPDQYDELKEEMQKLGIDVGIKGAACTLSQTPEELSMDMQSLLVMYGALGMLPFAGFTLAWFFINLLLPFDLPTAAYPVVVLGLTGALVAIIVEQAELSSPKIVKGQCPCCDTSVRAFFNGKDAVTTAMRKCQVCGTSMELDMAAMKLKLTGGPQFVSQ